MKGNILTPTSIWGNFKIEETPKIKIIDNAVDGAVSVARVYIYAPLISDNSTEIFATFIKPVGAIKCPSLLFINDFDKEVDFDLIKTIAKRGCSVLVIDLAGKREGVEHYTRYPEELNFAEYQNAKENLLRVTSSVVDTCWFVWTCCAKYALKYLEKEPTVTRIGIFGLGEAATIAWQVAGTEKDLACAVFGLNFGWVGYREMHKFAGTVEPQFSDEKYKFIAGVEPQTYAGHVKCPTLVLASTNSKKYDFDRVYDTLFKMTEAKYRGATYSVNECDSINGRAFDSAMVFLDRYLILQEDGEQDLPTEAEIKCELESGAIKFEVNPEQIEQVKSVELFVSEEISIPSERTWQKVAIKKNGQIYTAIYEPFAESGSVTAFARVNYKSGFAVGTMSINKKFTESDVKVKSKSKILYSSRNLNAEYVFCPATGSSLVYASKPSRVKIGKGPMGIDGVFSEYGLLTFKFKAKKDMPSDGSILMFDAFSKKSGELTVKLIADYFGNKIEYLSNVKLVGGEVWQNVKLETNRFKTVEGMPLKTYEIINAVEFISENEVMLNNALWV